MRHLNHIDFQLMRKRWLDSITGGKQDPQDPLVCKRLKNQRDEAQGFYRNMNRAENRTCLWEDLPDPNNVYVRDKICLASLQRIRSVALAIKTPGCMELQDQKDLLGPLIEALDFIHGNWYNQVQRKGGEWWHKEIGIPLCLNEIVLLLYDVLEPKQRSDYICTVESYTKDPDWMCIEDVPEISTGANRVWKCTALAGCGILKGDTQLLNTALTKIRSVFCHTNSGDGFYRDGSFIQHLKFPYTGGYGLSFLDTIVSYMMLTERTPWELQPDERKILLDWIENAFVPFMFRGAYMSMVRGREVSREEKQEHIAGHILLRSLLKLSDCLPDSDSLSLKQKIKTWIQQDTYMDFLSAAPLALLGSAQKLLRDDSIEPFAFPDVCKIFPSMDRVVHHRKHYSLGISMSSERTGKYESIHEENLRGWYTADGMVYLYNPDLSQFSEGFFPTVDAYRMPGITVDTGLREEKGVGFGKESPLHNAWCGGACLNRRYGAVGMELDAENTDLQARKSWFLFDDEIVCLGAGITAHSGRPVETVAENRKDPGKITLANGMNGSIQFIHFSGLNPGCDIGYCFPGSQKVKCYEEVRNDAWQRINHFYGSQKMIANHFAVVVLEHGVNPREDKYSYFLLPGFTADQTRAYAEAPQIDIVRNDASIQAVRHRNLDILAMNVWGESNCCVEGVNCSGAASLMIQKEAEVLSLAVADPTQKNREGLIITLPDAAREVISCDAGITVMQLMPNVKLHVRTDGAMGRTVEVKLKR